PGSDLFKETLNLAAMKTYAEEHPGTLKKVLKAVTRSIRYIKQNKKESQAIMTGWTGIEGTQLASIWENFVYALSLDHSLLTVLEDEARWVMDNGFTDKKKIPNYLNFIYLDAMKAVGPKAVSIMQ
ncbi:MAG: hypothetical protein HQK56_04390, partial [Deltaproteobacteria bacterium]|nr:hypothetical protein [Deltaproteobacteria bacterium]